MFIQVWIYGKYFVKNKWSEPVTSKKSTDSICCQWYNLSVQEKIRISEKPVSTTRSLTTSQELKTFLRRWVVIFMNMIFKYFTIKCQHLEDLHNLAKQYFPNDQCLMLQNNAWVKNPFKVQDRPIVTEY